MDLTVRRNPSGSAGGDDSTCYNVPFTVSTSWASDYSSLSWSHNGNGALTDPTSIFPTYTPGLGDGGNTVTLTLRVNGLANCNFVTYTADLFVKPFVTPTISGNNIVCEGDAGELYYTESGMSNYLWSVTGATTDAGGGINDTSITVTWTSPGVQTVSVNYTNAFGCTAATPVSLNVTVNPQPQDDLAVSDDQVCSYEDAQVVVTTGQNGITYYLRWNSDNRVIDGPYVGNGINDITFTIPSDSLATGPNVFNVYATTAAGCSVELTDLATVTKLLPIITTVFTDSVSCNGDNDGSAWVIAAGGTGAGTYTYLWNTVPPDNDSLITGQSAGTYIVQVTDAAGCQASDTAYIEEPEVLTFTYTKTNSTCNNTNDGTITFTAYGGTRPYQYSIYGDDLLSYSTDSVFTGLSDGTYYLIVMDANGCKTSEIPVVVTEPPLINIPYSVFNVDGCNGDSTGTINLYPTGGTGTQNLLCALLDTLTLTPNLASFDDNCSYNNLPAGSYYGYVRDTVSGCIRVANGGSPILGAAPIIITQPPAITFTVTQHTNVTGCWYNNNGRIRVSASGGTGTLTYWINGVQNTTPPVDYFRNLTIGTYYIQIIDDSLCYADTTIYITGPAPIVIDSLVVDSATCYGSADGAITIYASGGTGALTYTINAPGGPFQAVGTPFSGLVADTFNVRIRDGVNCTFDTTIIVLQPDPIIITSPVQYTPITCFGANDGTITIQASGGAGGLEYSIDGGLSYIGTNTFIGLSPDTFYVAVRDVNGCEMFSDTIYMVEPDPILIDSTNFTNITCNNADNGTITIYASGGTGTLTYSLFDLAPALITSNGSGIFGSLSAGSYYVEVDDINGCGPVISDTFVIINPPVLAILVDSADNISCNGDTDGAIYTTASGGTGTLSYALFNSAMDSVASNLSGDFTTLSADSYTITVTDSMGCTASTPIIILIEPDTISFVAQTATDISCFGYADGQIYIEPTGGTVPYMMIINSVPADTLYGNNATFTGLDAGSYIVSVTDVNNCSVEYSDTLIIAEPLLLVLDSTDVAGMSCNGDSATITIYATGDPGRTIEYSIDSGYTFVPSNVFTGLIAGTYYTAVQYNPQGCTVFGDTIIITEPTSIVVTTIDTMHIAGCAGDNAGGLQVSASGGGGTYIYIINTVPADTSLTGIFDSLYAGNYLVTAVDQYGCSGISNTISVLAPDVLNLLYGIAGPSCTDSIDARIMVNATGGYSPYTFEIMGDATETSAIGLFDSLAPGNYRVMATDTAGCAAISDTIWITNPAPVMITSNFVQDERCAGSNNGSITLNVTGGTGQYEYSTDGINWDTLNILGGLSPNTYYPQVRDQNGCLFTDTGYVVSAKPAIDFAVADSTNPLCYNDSTGTVTVLATGGNGGFTYIMPGDTNATGYFNWLSGGIQKVYTYDANGCMDSVVVALDDPDPIITSAFDTFFTSLDTGYVIVTIDSGGNPPYQYQIISGSMDIVSNPTSNTTMEYHNLDSGRYTFFVYDANGCISEELVVLLAPDSSHTYWYGFPIVTKVGWPQCPDDDVAIVFYTIPDNAVKPVYYSFRYDTLNPPLIPTNQDRIQRQLALNTYYVYIEDSEGKFFMDTIDVKAPNEIVPYMSVGGITCNLHESNGIVIFDSIHGGTPSFDYYQIVDPDTIELEYNYLSQIGDTGELHFYVEDSHGCPWDTTVRMTYDTIVIANAGPDTAHICWYSDTVLLYQSGGHSYEWEVDPAYNYEGDSALIHLPRYPGYTFFNGDSSLRLILTAWKYNRCYDKDTIMMIVLDDPELDLTINTPTDVIYGAEVDFLANRGSYFDSIWWYADTIMLEDYINDTTASFVIDSNIYYVVIGKDNYSCYDYDTIALKTYGEIEVPSGFSPNDDGFNDTWVIENSFGYPDLVVEVYNRWGNLVFKHKGYYKPWDGKRNGKALPSGTYYYVIYPNKEGYKSSSGTVTILE
ncbi:MAG: gliding motility-associated C-terminal domain-containing protein [Bacteroidales bacterium]|nr:gliding motility-associated C-terminal domain-containing protein [Bacteroidales bacterium]